MRKQPKVLLIVSAFVASLVAAPALLAQGGRDRKHDEERRHDGDDGLHDADDGTLWPDDGRQFSATERSVAEGSVAAQRKTLIEDK